MDAFDLCVEAAERYYNNKQNDPNGRDKSWEHCYLAFYNARRTDNLDIDILSLHLAFYLASWGMYRGSFLLQRDYKIHIPVINELLEKKYDCLEGIECNKYLDVSNEKALNGIEKFMTSYYGKVRSDVKGNDIKSEVSSTLITKILLGTLGCVPAYDRYFVAGIKSGEVATGAFNIKSIRMVADFFE